MSESSDILCLVEKPKPFATLFHLVESVKKAESDWQINAFVTVDQGVCEDKDAEEQHSPGRRVCRKVCRKHTRNFALKRKHISMPDGCLNLDFLPSKPRAPRRDELQSKYTLAGHQTHLKNTLAKCKDIWASVAPTPPSPALGAGFTSGGGSPAVMVYMG